MDLITVNTDKCIKCGNCVGECPMRIIEIENNIPIAKAERIKACISCGHCEAVCPSSALDFNYKGEQSSAVTNFSSKISVEQIEHYVRNRRSVRRFTEQEASRQTLEKVLDIARFSPTGGNRQFISWLVISKTEKIKTMSKHVIDYLDDMIKKNPKHPFAAYIPSLIRAWDKGVDPICHGAPHLIIAHAPANYPLSLTDSTIALSYLDLTLPAFGLGGCWCGFFTMAATSWEPLQKELQLPQGNISFGTMLVGFPKYKYKKIPKRNQARIIWK